MRQGPKRPPGLRRRDWHLLAVVSAVLAANVATTAGYWFVVRRDLRDVERRTSATISDVATVATNAATRADALAAVLVRHGATGGSSEDGETEAPSRPQFLGAGQTKLASGDRWLYYDVRDENGDVSRRYVRPPRRRPSLPPRSAVPNVLPDASERSEAEANVAD